MPLGRECMRSSTATAPPLTLAAAAVQGAGSTVRTGLGGEGGQVNGRAHPAAGCWVGYMRVGMSDAGLVERRDDGGGGRGA